MSGVDFRAPTSRGELERRCPLGAECAFAKALGRALYRGFRPGGFANEIHRAEIEGCAAGNLVGSDFHAERRAQVDNSLAFTEGNLKAVETGSGSGQSLERRGRALPCFS